MIWLSFGKWNRSAGDIFTRERIYIKGKWTPFVTVKRRYSSLSWFFAKRFQEKEYIIRNVADGSFMGTVRAIDDMQALEAAAKQAGYFSSVVATREGWPGVVMLKSSAYKNGEPVNGS